MMDDKGLCAQSEWLRERRLEPNRQSLTVRPTCKIHSPTNRRGEGQKWEERRGVNKI